MKMNTSMVSVIVPVYNAMPFLVECLESIINQLGTTISYEKDGYIGEYLLNTQNIQIKTNYNGFREDLIEETIYTLNLSIQDNYEVSKVIYYLDDTLIKEINLKNT